MNQAVNNKLRIPETLRKVKNIVGVFSAKGGVGKSAVALQLAISLKNKGYKVGLVDADIYGPSVGMMLGISSDLKPTIKEEKYFEPIKINGIRTMSMSFLVNENTPMVLKDRFQK